MVAAGADRYGPLRTPELRWLCNQRGLSPYGLKRDLIAQLDEQDGQNVESSSECFASGLEPFRELEELAAQLKASPSTAATPKSAAKAKAEPVQTKAVPPMADPSVPMPAGPMPSLVAPAQAKMPPPSAQGLTSDERALRGLLEFFACSDVQSTGQNKLFALKYREFVKTVFDFLQSDITSATPTSMASTAAAAAAAAAAATTDAILRGNGLAEVAPDLEILSATDAHETWASEMWQKAKEIIDTHLKV